MLDNPYIPGWFSFFEVRLANVLTPNHPPARFLHELLLLMLLFRYLLIVWNKVILAAILSRRLIVLICTKQEQGGRMRVAESLSR